MGNIHRPSHSQPISSVEGVYDSIDLPYMGDIAGSGAYVARLSLPVAGATPADILQSLANGDKVRGSDNMAYHDCPLGVNPHQIWPIISFLVCLSFPTYGFILSPILLGPLNHHHRPFW